jgi:hypothetical protein
MKEKDMDFFEKDKYENEREETSYASNPFDMLKGVGILFGVLFAPSIAVGVLIFLVFLRKLKWRPSVTFIPLALAFLVLSMFLPGQIEKLALIDSFASLKENWRPILMAYLYIAVMAGIHLGYGIVLYKVIELKRYPEYVHLRGWAYGFQYAPTPLDKWRKKKNIQSLKNGEMFDYEKAPIGILDEPVVNADLERTLDTKNANKAAIVYRNYTEAMSHTLITGSTGSGKALHIDTELRTRKGWTTVGKVRVGDYLYDDEGNYTKVTAIYRPMTQDHYEITFDSGQVVKACGDHLWNIGDVSENNTVCTRDLYKNYSHKVEYTIEHKIDNIERVHTILKIKKIQDIPGDYLCFTVDAPSHLFLITRAHIPTHNTVTMLNLIKNDILAGHPLCVIDFKKSPDLIYFLSKWAQENNREFFHFVSGKPGTYRNPYKDDQATYDPLSTGGATAKADMILNLRTWDTASEVFKKRTQDVLQSLFFLLERTPRSEVPEIEWDNGGLAQFVSALDLNNFKKMIEIMAMDMQAGKLSAGDIRRYNTLTDLYKELSAKTKSDIRAQIVELLSIARTLIVSNYGDWLAKGASAYHIDLMKIATSQDAPIVLFSFNQQEEPEFAQYIGSIVMSDLSRVSALKNAKGDMTRFGVYIDEFQTLDPRTVKDNLEKARSSRMYITLSLQSIDQIVSAADSAGEAMANGILDTCGNFIFHDGSGYDTATKMSKIIGESDYYVYKTTAQTDGKVKFRLMSVHKAMVGKNIENGWLVPPKEFQSLSAPNAANNYKATAYVINKSPNDNRFKRGGGALARKVQVIVPDDTAQGVPTEFKKQIFVDANEVNFRELQKKAEAEILAQTEEKQNDDGDWVVEDEKVENVELSEKNNYEFDLDFLEEEVPAQLSKPSTQKKAEVTPKRANVDILGQNEQSQLDVFKQLNSGGNKKSSPAKKSSAKSEPKKAEEFKLPDLDF